MFISGISYQLGALQSLEQLEELAANPSLCRTLVSQGVRNYSRMDVRELYPNIEGCLLRTMHETETQEREIDGLIVGSSTVFSHLNWDLIGKIFKKFNLQRAALYGISLAECANFVSALVMAEMLLKSGRMKNILIVLADIIDGRSRVVPPSISIYSDAVCSCLVSAEKEFGLEITHVDSHVDNSLWTLNRTSQILQYMDAFAKNTRRFIEKFFGTTGLERQSVDAFIGSNYNQSISLLYSHLSSIPIERFFLKNIGRIGHTYACDNLINLKDYCEGAIPTRAEKLFLLATGVGAWGGAMVTRAVGNSPAFDQKRDAVCEARG